MDTAMAALGLFMMAVGLLLLGSFGALMYYIYQRSRENPADNTAGSPPAEPEGGQQQGNRVIDCSTVTPAKAVRRRRKETLLDSGFRRNDVGEGRNDVGEGRNDEKTKPPKLQRYRT